MPAMAVISSALLEIPTYTDTLILYAIAAVGNVPNFGSFANPNWWDLVHRHSYGIKADNASTELLSKSLLGFVIPLFVFR
jgi:hypothetical protein